MRSAWLVLVASSSAFAGPSLPSRLADTGLYEPSSLVVRAGNRAFSPQYPLWSDGAAKRRWIFLPPGTSIDATSADAWEFPRGTQLWKEFSHGGRPIETRYLERGADGQWRFAAYIWNAQGTDALLAPDNGQPDLPAPTAPGGVYDIPSQGDCRACHEGARVPVLGFSAVQLATQLQRLADEGVVRDLPDHLLRNPPRIAAGSAEARAALGYLHANCAHCHSGTDAAPPVDFLAAQLADDPASTDRVLRSMLGLPSTYQPAGFPPSPRVVAPGDPQRSVLIARMRSRDPQMQMPPIGTRIPDARGIALIERWILSLPPENAP